MSQSETVTIEQLGWRGHGLARRDGRLHPVPGALPGETARVEWRLDRRGRRHGHLLAVGEAHPARVDPRCAQFDRCPGCPLRCLEPEAALEAKVQTHLQSLERFGVDLTGLPVTRLASGPQDAHRARATARAFPGGVLGLGGHPGEAAVRLADCPAQTERCRQTLARVERALAHLPPFEAASERGLLRHVVVQAASERPRVVVVTAAPVEPPTVEGVDLFMEVIAPGDFSTLKRPTLVAGQAHSEFSVGGDRLRATLPAWTPQSPDSVPELRRAVAALLAPTPSDRILELGCGVGTLSLPLARLAGSLVGVDRERAATLDAQHNAARNQVPNATFRVGEADHALRRLLSGGYGAERVLLHAMRRPFGPRVMRLLAPLRPRRVVYIAPSAPSLARDLEHARGLRLRGISFLDQTPGTASLLTVALLEP